MHSKIFLAWLPPMLSSQCCTMPCIVLCRFQMYSTFVSGSSTHKVGPHTHT